MDPFTGVTASLGANLEFTGSHPGSLSPTGLLQIISPFLTYLFSQNRQELDIFKRPPHQRWWEQGAVVSQSCEKVYLSMAGLRCISLVKIGDQDLGAY